MRFLLLLQCWLLFIFVQSQEEKCDWKIPVDYQYCKQDIPFKVNDDKQALATCLEYFPTTFVEGTYDTTNNKIICKVSRQFHCDFIANSVSIFDKCYTFDKKEVTMKDYIDNRGDYCKTDDNVSGGIPVFLTMTQAKHIAMKAHREGISKIWVNVNKEGKTFEARGDMELGRMLYKEPWKLHKAHYWVGDTLKVTPKDDEGKYKVPDAEYLFFRSKTDHWNNLFQGSFERASEDSTASIVCEYTAKIANNAIQNEKYCERLGEKGLGLNAVYDRSIGKQRCVYTTLTVYPLLGTKDAIQSFTGCGEKPSDQHSSGLDDGTANKNVYNTLTSFKKRGTYRFAAIKVSIKSNNEVARQYATRVRKHCDSGNVSKRQRHPYEIFDHSMNSDFGVRIKAEWHYKYPKDECSDFPSQDMYSNTLAIRNGYVIDVPTPVLLPAICSIASISDCSRNKDLCSRKYTRNDLFCEDVHEYQVETELYATCKCPRFHTEDDGVCKWYESNSKMCARGILTNDVQRWGFYSGTLNLEDYKENINSRMYNEKLRTLVIRSGCTATFYALKKGQPNNVIVFGPVGMGEHDFPDDELGTSRGWDGVMGPSSFTCACNDAK